MELKENFTVIPNSIIQGVGIKDLASIALYCFLRSHSAGFSYNWRNVKKSLNIGKSKYYETLKLLEKYGYIQTEQTKQKNGQFGNTKVLIYGRDFFELPCTELPYTELPYTVKQDYNNNISNKDKLNNKNLINKKERENENKTLSHFDYLFFNFKDETLELVNEYKPKINSDFEFCIEKFNATAKKPITIIALKSYFWNWVKNNKSIIQNKNNNSNEIFNNHPSRKKLG